MSFSAFFAQRLNRQVSVLKGAAVASLALLTVGCDTLLFERAPLATPSESAREYAFRASEYRLGAGDKLKINVFNEPDLTGEYTVAANGTVRFPLAGEVKAANQTLSQFEGAVRGKLRGTFVKDPRVTAEVITYRPFFILGEIRNAGQFPYKPNLTAQEAVAIAGGYSYRANTRYVIVRRAGSDNEYTHDLDAHRVVLLPGDTIRIPERFF
jgi:protein involved in polysaccharide export with SLBB domain